MPLCFTKSFCNCAPRVLHKVQLHIFFLVACVWNNECAKLKPEAPSLFFFQSPSSVKSYQHRLALSHSHPPATPQLTDSLIKFGPCRKSGISGVISQDRHPEFGVASSAPFPISFASQEEPFRPFGTPPLSGALIPEVNRPLWKLATMNICREQVGFVGAATLKGRCVSWGRKAATPEEGSQHTLVGPGWWAAYSAWLLFSQPPVHWAYLFVQQYFFLIKLVYILKRDCSLFIPLPPDILHAYFKGAVLPVIMPSRTQRLVSY